MIVLVDNGSYRMDNLGDVAMLQVCVRRIRERWPEARVRVLVETPERLRAACPEAEPLLPGRWHSVRAIPYRLQFRGSYPLERRAQLSLPVLAYLGRRRAVRDDREVRDGIERFYRAVRGADAAVCSGGGFITDWHAEHGDRVLHTLGLAQAFGRPTAMFGAGLGPLSRRVVRRLAGPVLSRLDVLALREGEGSLRELASLGVRNAGVTVTGDDAIEPAYLARPAAPGGGIGLSIRLAPHSQAPRERLTALAGALREVAGEYDAALVPAPVRSRLSPDNDIDAMRAMFPSGTVDLSEAEQLDAPTELIRVVGRCRVVVTGAYHAAVFALSQGIPVVALAGTTYYDRKFAGLREQFGGGVEVIRYDEADLPERLKASVREGWAAAPWVRDPLLRAAARQIARSRSAYETFFDLVDRRAGGRRRLAGSAAGGRAPA